MWQVCATIACVVGGDIEMDWAVSHVDRYICSFVPVYYSVRRCTPCMHLFTLRPIHSLVYRLGKSRSAPATIEVVSLRVNEHKVSIASVDQSHQLKRDIIWPLNGMRGRHLPTCWSVEQAINVAGHVQAPRLWMNEFICIILHRSTNHTLKGKRTQLYKHEKNLRKC